MSIVLIWKSDLKILFIRNNLDKTKGLFYIKVHGNPKAVRSKASVKAISP